MRETEREKETKTKKETKQKKKNKKFLPSDEHGEHEQPRRQFSSVHFLFFFVEDERERRREEFS